MKNKKIILSIFAIIAIFLIGGAAYYITTRTATTAPVAPTAPESEPLAAEPCPTGLSCVNDKTSVPEAKACLNTSGKKVWCCPAGQVADTTKKNCVAGTPTTSVTPSVSPATTDTTTDWQSATACSITGIVIAAAGTPKVTVVKDAYKDISTNTAGNYNFDTAITTVGKDQIFVYGLKVTNTGTADASGVKLTDTLKDNGLDGLTIVDKDSRCSFDTTTRLMTCTLNVEKSKSVTIGFRVKASNNLVNGAEITNMVKAELTGQTDVTDEMTLTASSVLGCNHTCTTDAECSSGFVCDEDSGKCRNNSCLSSTSCVCPTATITGTVTATGTPRVTATATPTATSTPIEVAEVTITTSPTTLPSAGIFDIPGAAIFGGGLLMTIVGILLAL